MTNEQIISKLKGYKGIIMYPTDEAEALKDAAISALEQQCPVSGGCKELIKALPTPTKPCKDAVSREAAIKACMGMRRYTGIDEAPYDYAESVLTHLPSVTVPDCQKCDTYSPCIYCEHEFKER